MPLPSNLDTIPSLAEGRRLAALYFGELRYGLRLHSVRAAATGDHGIVLLTGDGYAFLASEAIGNNALLVVPAPAEVSITPGIYLTLSARGLQPVDLASATQQERDRIEEALASYRAMHRPEEALPVQEIEADDTEETLPPAASLPSAPFSSEDLAAIAQFMDGDTDTNNDPVQDVPDSAESTQRIAVALSADQVSLLLSLDYLAEMCADKLEAVRQGRELVTVLDQRVVLDYSPSQERFIGILHRNDKAFLDATLSAPSSLPTPHANSSVDATRNREELERTSR